MTILERTINPLIIMYCGALYDVIMTFVGIFFFGGKEANPILNWIDPPYLIPIVALCLFIIGMVGILGLLKLLDYICITYNRDISGTVTWLNRAFVFVGFWHFCTGSTWLVW